MNHAARKGLIPALALAMLSAACADANEPKPVTTGPPVVTARSIELDYAAKVAEFSLSAADPDTTVAIRCDGAFVAAGQGTVHASGSFAELRHHPAFFTICVLEAPGDAPVEEWIQESSVTPLDVAPTVQWPEPAGPPRANVPMLFSMSADDDWGITWYRLSYARGDVTACLNSPVRLRTTELAAPVLAIADTMTITFAQPGQYCLFFQARDDHHPIAGGSGQTAGTMNLVEVLE